MDVLHSPAKRYSTVKYIFAIGQTVFLLAVAFVFQASGLSASWAGAAGRALSNYYLALAAYLLLSCTVYFLLDSPSNFVSSFTLEHQFNLSNQKIGDWVKDYLKSFAISLVILIILGEAFYYILNEFAANWWLIASLFWVFFSVVLARLTPVVLIPLFFKYKPLSDNELKARILTLAAKMKVKILDVFEIDFSRKTVKANAAFVGVGKTKRVILADTLKDKYGYDEIEVILAHEFAHYHLKHLLKLIFINAAGIVLTFYIIFRTNGYILGLFGLDKLSDIAAFPIIVLYMTIIGIIITPLTNYLSRCFEHNADRMALEVTGLKEAFISTMDKLAQQNLADRKPSFLIKMFFFDHPPIDERIAMAKRHPLNPK